MGWRTPMYEVWHSQGASMQLGPKFRLLGDALRHISAHASEASFAIRTPEGIWYKDPDTGRSIFGRGGVSQPMTASLPGWEDERTLARGSGPIDPKADPRVAHGTGKVVVMAPPRDDDEPTDVEWPPALGTEPGTRPPRGRKDD